MVETVLGQTRHHSLHDESLTRNSHADLYQGRGRRYMFAQVLMGPGLRAQRLDAPEELPFNRKN